MNSLLSHSEKFSANASSSTNISVQPQSIVTSVEGQEEEMEVIPTIMNDQDGEIDDLPSIINDQADEIETNDIDQLTLFDQENNNELEKIFAELSSKNHPLAPNSFYMTHVAPLENGKDSNEYFSVINFLIWRW